MASNGAIQGFLQVGIWIYSGRMKGRNLSDLDFIKSIGSLEKLRKGYHVILLSLAYYIYLYFFESFFRFVFALKNVV